MQIRIILILSLFSVSTLVHSQMNFKNLDLSLTNRINYLIDANPYLSYDSSFRLLNVYIFQGDTLKLDLFVNNKLPIDSLTPMFITIETETLVKKYLNTSTYIIDQYGNLIAYGNAGKLIEVYEDDVFGRTTFRRGLINILSNPETKMVMRLGRDGGYRSGFYLVIKDDGFHFYETNMGEYVEISKQKYLEIISESLEEFIDRQNR
jgi:hypothetical protein